MGEKMPVLFVGHGSPMNIVSDNRFTRSLAAWGKRLPRPRAILSISAHWLTDGTFVGCMEKPRTIHDFYGFPRELYTKDYPCSGAPDEAEFAAGLVRKAPVGCRLDWGLDHGTWSVLLHLFPRADIPVFQLSLDYTFNDWNPKPLRHHYELAKELAPLRDRGVLIIGSGNIVHNLGIIDFENVDAEPLDWALEFDEEVKTALISRNDTSLVGYEELASSALAVPTLDHYLPLIYSIALREQGEPLTFTHEGFQHASISMRCFQIG
ncbi:MAG: 4,5-DOPA dioxygenase extradiol [Nitrospiraceae bacterium]|nr:4,5-DOPA dioxygenase extradiol [Nitrospiraceae bacterium]